MDADTITINADASVDKDDGSNLHFGQGRYILKNDDDDIEWNTEDEKEIEISSVESSGTSLTQPGYVAGSDKASSSAGPSNSKIVDHFLAMGFSENLVVKAIQENGEDDPDSVLNALLTYSALDDSSEMQPSNDSEQPVQKPVDSDLSSFEDDESNIDDNLDSDSSSDSEENFNFMFEEENKLLCLVDMGYSVNEACLALERCGENASIEELADMICAAQIAKADDALFGDLPSGPKPSLRKILTDKRKKRKSTDYERGKGKKLQRSDEDDSYIHLPKVMIGFGVPTQPCTEFHRSLPEAAKGPPYFYYENVAFAPKGVWTTISRFLYEVEPEFVDSKHFCAAARKRGYVHNLPIDNRFPILPFPPRTIFEAFPLTKKWWPSWDSRTKLNCLLTSIGSAKSTERIRKILEANNGDPPPHVQKLVTHECRKWNYVWVGRNKVAPLEPDEVEMLLGFPKNHTRGGGISRTDRYKSLGNAFQVDTVAYHLSVLKPIYPNGINVLSLFAGIGGAEVALHRLGIHLKNVVSVEISEVNRNILTSWWEQTNQKGNLIHIPDIEQLDGSRLEELMSSFGGFDLVIGGSPCNNLTGSNRVSRDGLEGKESILFYDFYRILDLVRSVLPRKD